MKKSWVPCTPQELFCPLSVDVHPRPFFIIAGPCVLQNDDINAEIADELCTLMQEFKIPFIFKGSFDKANRTSSQASRGPGLEAGLAMLGNVRTLTGLPVLTDVHSVEQVKAAAAVCHVLQIPAFLARQTDLLLAAAATNLPVNIKKGQWMSPEQACHALLKVRGSNLDYPVAITERGTFFGYHDLVVDMRNIHHLQYKYLNPVIFDATHSVQQPGAMHTAGERRYILPLMRAAVAVGVDGLFVEVHPRPAESPSDSESILHLAKLREFVEQALTIRQVVS